MKAFFPATGSLEEWNAAYYRLEDYLRAHGVVNKIHQSQIILRLLQRAATRHQSDPAQDPTRLAMEEAYAEIDEWFQGIFGEDEVPGRLSNLGRVSLYILDAPQQWPQAFLSPRELPPDFVNAMRQISVQSGPDLRVSTMVPTEPDIAPTPGILKEALRKLDQVLS